MAKNFIIERLKQEFGHREVFTREELYNFYRLIEPDLKETTFRWRIFELKQKGIIRPLSRNEFSLTYKPNFRPLIEEQQTRIFFRIEKQFPQLKQCVWSTKMVNEFMMHLPGRFTTILEVEKEALDSVFYYLKDNNIRNVYVQPEEKEIERYLFEDENAIILKNLISKAPVQKIKKFTTTTIEKLLVDLYCDNKMFTAFQGHELEHIINTAYEKYAIDFTKLFSYAARRGREIEIMEFLSDRTQIHKSLLND